MIDYAIILHFQLPYNHWFYRCSVWANIISFALFRFLPVFYITYGMYMWHHRVTPLYFYGLCFSMLTMHCINMVLFYRLVKNDIFRYNRQCQARKLQGTSLNGASKATGTSSSLNNNVKDCDDEYSNGFVKAKAS